jgi:hypothetical protein
MRLNEFPGLQHRGEPGVERLIRRHLIKKAAVDEPHLPGVAHRVVVTEETLAGGPSTAISFTSFIIDRSAFRWR